MGFAVQQGGQVGRQSCVALTAAADVVFPFLQAHATQSVSMRAKFGAFGHPSVQMANGVHFLSLETGLLHPHKVNSFGSSERLESLERLALTLIPACITEDSAVLSSFEAFCEPECFSWPRLCLATKTMCSAFNAT